MKCSCPRCGRDYRRALLHFLFSGLAVILTSLGSREAPSAFESVSQSVSHLQPAKNQTTELGKLGREIRG